MNHYSSHRAACRQWSAALAVLILLVAALAALPPTKLLWAAGPVLLLGLVEAAYAAQERRCAELLKTKKEDAVLSPEPASASVVRTTFAAMSLSIWPFYLGLFAIVAIGGEQMTASDKKGLLVNAPQNSQPAGMVRTVAANSKSSGGCGSACSAGSSGGCGSSGACGSGGCGSGKGCSSGAEKMTVQMPRPVQPYMQTATGQRPT